ncbi:MAG: ABC-F family ATP-binding cassette domain-containing protein [Candidatus Fermentibacteraceae bacterium]|nr:ABC-F family ATP-binding cassette domain-containing protein [Candidatus Fermentibacteraceae bacterium]
MTGADGPSRVDGVVQKAGQLSRTALGRMNRAKEGMESVTFRKSYSRGIEFPGEKSDRNSLAEFPEGVIEIGELRLYHPSLSLLPEDRIALTGPNGCGKSTIVRLLVESMDLPEGRLLYIPQELTADQSARVLSTAGDLGPEVMGSVMSCVRRLGSDPEPLLKSARPSPGETRKLMLCLGLLENPWIVIMDEPTNHLDLPGIECLEAALSKLESALLLVSHDRRFLSNTTETEWRITDDGSRKNLHIF